MNYQAVIHDATSGRWRAFKDSEEIVKSCQLDEVLTLLNYVEQRVKAGMWAVGFVSYEASPAFDSSLTVKEDSDFPKIWFAIFDKSEIIDLPEPKPEFFLGPWSSEISRSCYLSSVSKVKDKILRGDSYQTNLTFRQQARFLGDAFNCFLTFISRQSTDYGAYLDCGDFSICSASPELFFNKTGSQILTKPMKGTARREAESLADSESSEDLKASIKNRSENVMIVDMLRNDLSRIGNNVRALSLFDVQPYQTLWQMTSTIEAYSESPLTEIMTALFPCASITGAPKCSTMRIISDLEHSARRVYSAAIGFLSPELLLPVQFNVGIRTILIDHKESRATYGVGSGIVWDSDSEKEYEECLLKAEATPTLAENFALLETMLWEPENGFNLLERHLARLQKTAAFFCFSFDNQQIKEYLSEISSAWDKNRYKVRLLLSIDGRLRHEKTFFEASSSLLKLKLSKTAINSKNIFLAHKTTERSVYKKALAECGHCDDVLLFNERYEITESCIGNLAFRLGQDWYTPPLECGLLDGTYRQELIENGKISEKMLLVSELKEVNEFAILNSVRGWSRAEIDLTAS